MKYALVTTLMREEQHGNFRVGICFCLNGGDSCLLRQAGESLMGSRADSAAGGGGSKQSSAGYRATQGQRNATLGARAAAQQQQRRAPGLAQGAAFGAAAAAVRRCNCG